MIGESSKKCYRNIPLDKKISKDKFNECVKESIRSCSIEHVRKFSGKARRYMLTYLNLDENDMSYDNIERFVKTCKCHRNVEDQDWAYVNNIWSESIKIKDEVTV